MNPTNKLRPIHPGEILREEFLVPMAMSGHKLHDELKQKPLDEINREARVKACTLAKPLSFE